MATVVEDFLESAPDGTAHALQLLGVAESLTDELAQELYGLAPIEGLSAELFVRALHYSDFITPRNSEWHIAPEVRRELQGLNVASQEIVEEAHKTLMRHGEEEAPGLAGSVIPRYLFTNAGKAYHKAALGMADEAFTLYVKATTGSLTGAQWLASKLADEQEARGVLPPGRIETTFLRAMVLFREDNWNEAEPLMRRVAATDGIRIEVAIAMNILGNRIGWRNVREAEAFFRRSIEIDDSLGNRHGVAQTQHCLANLIGRDGDHRDEAEELYRRSIRLLDEIGDSYGVAQTQHSLANLIGRDRDHRDEAEELYRRSIRLLDEIGDSYGVAQTEHSLANLIGRDRSRRDEAEELYRRSIEIGESLGDRHGVAQRLHSFANLIGRDRNRRDEAEGFYRRSIEIGEEIDNPHHIAQTLHSLANLIRRDRNRRDEAEELLQDSLRIGEDLKNLLHQAQVLRSLSFVVEHKSPKEAEQLLEQSLDLNRRARNRQGIELVRESLKQLRERYDM